MSFPDPAMMQSRPPLAAMVSLPRPPMITSLPEVPVRVSSPGVPMMTLAPWKPAHFGGMRPSVGSQASPMPSPSTSAWRVLRFAGQLSAGSAMVSRSVSGPAQPSGS